MAEELRDELRLRQETPSRIERKRLPEEVQEPVKEHHRPGFVDFMAMILVAIGFDIVGFFANEVPFVGAFLVLVSDAIFIPWFHFAGMKFNSKRVVAMGVESIAESIPVVGNFPLITINVIVSYYLN